MYRVETTPEFDEDLESLDRAIARRIVRKVEWLTASKICATIKTRKDSKKVKRR